MAFETEAVEMLNQILSIDDKEFEENYDNMMKFFEIENNFYQSIIEKTAYCRANNLTAEDLLEENKIAENEIPEQLKTLSKSKQDFMKFLIDSSVKINNAIIEKGLHPSLNVRVQRLWNNEKLPSYAHASGDSGLDIYATEDIIIPPHETIKTPVGIKVAIPLGFELQVRPKSGMSLNQAYHNLFVANSPGTIDANYRNEVEIILKNMGDLPLAISKDSKFAQFVLCPVYHLNWVEVDDINEYPTERKGGFGSTGV